MSGNLSGFNAADVEPNEGFTPLPAGEYQAIISESEMKPTKDGQGKYLQLKLQILNGQHQNRTLFDRLNLVNKLQWGRSFSAPETTSDINRWQ